MIAKQGFETSEDTWNPVTFSTQPCTSNGDTWDYQTSWQDLLPTEGTQFWAIEDLQGDCGSSNFESIYLSEIDISSFRQVQLSFDYFFKGYNSTDRIKYQLIINKEALEEVMLYAPGTEGNTETWKSEFINIPNYAKTVELIISVKQNAQGDYAGFDNIKLEGIEIVPCSQLMISELAEGTSSSNHRNNYVEIYNPSDSPIDLSNYDLVSYRNSSEQHISPLKLEGVIPAYGVFLVEDETENLNINAQLSTNSAVLDFTGDDKIALRQNGEIIDLIGKIGDSVPFYENITLRRKREINFPTSDFNQKEWIIASLEDISDFNRHNSYCKEASPQITLFGNGIEIISNSPATIYENNTFFGTHTISNTPISKEFTIRNQGIADLEISSFTLLYHADIFELVAPNSIIIPPGGSRNFTLSFLPDKTGFFDSEILIKNNDPSQTDFRLKIYAEVGGETNGPLLITQYYQGTGSNKWIEITNTSSHIIHEGEFYLCAYTNEMAFNPHNEKPTVTKAIPTLEPGESILFHDPNAVEPNYALNLPKISSTTARITGNDILLISSNNKEKSWENRIDVIGTAGQWTESASYVRKYGCEDAKPFSVFDPTHWNTLSIEAVNSAKNGYNEKLGEHYIGSVVFENGTWTNGLPEIIRPITIKSNYNTQIHGEFEACHMIVDENVQVEISAGNSIKIVNDIVNKGKVIVDHEGSITASNDEGLVSGNDFEIHKTVNNLKPNDYIYWSSPVVGAEIRKVFPNSNPNSFFWFNTQEFEDNDKDSYEDNHLKGWQIAQETMAKGRGYTAMAENLLPFKSEQQFVFKGSINNGKILVPIQISSKDTVLNNNWNFIGNPYPSPIDIHQLLANENNANLINGAVYFWTHHSSANNGKYSSSNYAAYVVGTGGIKAADDGLEPSGYLASCQGVFVNAKKAGQLEFNNGMRVKDPGNIFFKNEIKDRIWLSVSNSEGIYHQILLGFSAEATSAFDPQHDALLPPGENLLSFYSLNKGNKFIIQGLEPFHEEQVIHLGFNKNIEEAIELNLKLDRAEGELLERKVLLYDKSMNVIHDMKNSYQFSLGKNEAYNDRFQLFFKEEKKLIFDTDELEVEVTVKTNPEAILFETNGKKKIIKTEVFDLLGRSIIERKLNHHEWILQKQDLKDHFYIVQLQFDDYTVYNKKLIINK
ncbi:lamin tail domain-containing protein [Namhaeicola litoreus]|uniref:Lamin tail domain-containing protein n=1 Tax=Namhaeicola litoreus TaxID=1052145 RepID=A0ABW3XYY8_9FLAO